MRTIEEVRAYFAKLDSGEIEDFLGFKREVLQPYMIEQIEPEHAAKVKALAEELTIKDMKEYLNFAFTKAGDHRGISAGRSIQKLSTWAWLLGRDDLVEFAEADKNYKNYGVPILKRFAMALDVTPPDFIASWPDGGPCEPGCEQGCG